MNELGYKSAYIQRAIGPSIALKRRAWTRSLSGERNTARRALQLETSLISIIR
jgi:hypothetical protein